MHKDMDYFDVKLKDSQFQSLDILLDSVPGVFYRMEPESINKFTFFSQGVKDLLGKTPAQLQSVYNPLVFYSQKDADTFNSRIELIKGKKSNKGVVKYKLVDSQDKVRSIKDTFSIVTDSYGNLVALEGYWEEQLMNRGNLLNKLNAYKDAIDISIISSITDTRGIITHVNDNFCRISKYSKTELIGQNHNIVRSNYHSKKFFSDMWRTIGAKEPWYGEILNRAKDGSLYWVDTVIIPICNSKQKIESYLSLRILTTSRKDAERKGLLYQHALEELTFLISHKLRGPICSLQGLADLLKAERDNDRKEKIIDYMFECINNLEGISRHVSDFVYQNNIEFKMDDSMEKIYTKYPPETVAYIYNENNYLNKR